MLEQLVQNLEKNPQSARIKKLVFCCVNNRWSNDAQHMSSPELQQHLHSLIHQHASIVEFKHALYQIVMRLNHSQDYYTVANDLCVEVEKIYESLPASGNHPPVIAAAGWSLPDPAATTHPITSIISLQISADREMQGAHAFGEVIVAGQLQAAVTIAIPFDLIQDYSEWQSQYRKLEPIPRRVPNGIANLAPDKINHCQDATTALIEKVQTWLQTADCQRLNAQIRRHIPPTATVQVLVTSDLLSLLKLPWNLCLPLLLPDHPQAEVVVRLAPALLGGHSQVAICSVIANGIGIDREKSQSFLQALPDTHSQFLVEAETSTVLQSLEKPGSVLFISSYLSGYSTQERIFVNANDSITSAELRSALQVAVRQGLQLLILNVGDGLEMAADLAAVRVPHMVVMREPMPDRVANELMKLILKTMVNGQSLPAALRASRTRLKEVEGVFPAVSWLPVLCQPRAANDLMWSDLGLIQPAGAAPHAAANGYHGLPLVQTISPVVVTPSTPPPVIQIPPAVEYDTLSLGQCLTGYYSEVHALAISADRQLMISGHGDIGGKDNNVKVWRLDNGELIHDWIGHNNWVNSIALQPNSQQVFSSGADGKILAWDLHTGSQQSFQIKTPFEINASIVSPDGQKILVGGDDGTIQVWQLAPCKLQQSLAGHLGRINAIGITSDSQVIATAGQDGIVRVWNIITNQLIHQFSGHSSSINGLAITNDGQQVISAGIDRTIRVWNVFTGEPIHTLVGHERPVNCLVLSPDGQSIISGSDDKTIKIWDLATGDLVNNLFGHESPILTLAISNDGQILVSGGYGEIRIWEIN